MVAAEARDLAVVNERGELDRYFHPGQRAAYDSEKRFTLVLAGSQGGKTSFGPHWLLREMQRCGPGDYMVVTPTFTLLEIKALPEFRKLFESILRLGRYVGSPVRKFTLTPEGERRLWGKPSAVPTNVYFGYAEDPESLESATLKGLWCDEAGQKKFKLGSWEALRRRIALHRARALLTTTPYNLGWLKTTFWDPWIAANKDHPDIDVINFPSIANPQFSPEEFADARAYLPGWKFNMFYLGLFERPAGLIYDSFTDDLVIPDFAIPEAWPRFLGADFGGVNTAAVFLAKELNAAGAVTGRFIAYREYHKGGRTAAQHTDALRAGEPRLPTAYGGAKSEDQWRQEFAAAGLGIDVPPVPDVEVGINRVYGLFKAKKLLVFRSLTGLRDQLGTYSRPLDANGEPMEGIEDKATFHFNDALRYVCVGVTTPPLEVRFW